MTYGLAAKARKRLGQPRQLESLQKIGYVRAKDMSNVGKIFANNDPGIERPPPHSIAQHAWFDWLDS